MLFESVVGLTTAPEAREGKRSESQPRTLAVTLTDRMKWLLDIFRKAGA